MKKYHFIYACSFFYIFGHNVLNFSLIYRLRDMFSFSTGQIGAYIAFGNFFFFLGCIIYYRFGTAFNPSKILPISTTAVFLASIPLGYFRVLSPVYVSFWLLMFSTSLFWPPILAWLTEGLSGNELSSKISYFSRSCMAALIIAPPVAGQLYQFNSDINFIVVSLCFFISVFLILFARRSPEEHNDEKKGLCLPAKPSDDGKQNPIPLHPDKKLDHFRYVAWIGSFCSIVFIGVLINILPIHIRDTMGYTEGTAGWILFTRCVAAFAGFILLAKYTSWHFNFRWFFILHAGLMFCAVLFLLAGSQLYLYFGIVVLYGLINAAIGTKSIFYSRATGKNPKKNITIHEMFHCAGAAAGSAGGGLLYQHFGFAGICLALLLMLSLVAGVFVIIRRKSH